MTQLICKDLVRGYDGRAVTSGLNFQVEKGDYLCIVGENGAGKSTLIKALLGLNPPISGAIEKPGGLKAAAIGYLPQHTEVQKDFPASVREIVLSGCLGKDLPAPPREKKKSRKPEKKSRKPEKSGRKKEKKAPGRLFLLAKRLFLAANPVYTRGQKALAARQMERLGITGLQNRCYRELSGGQKQRVLLARALCATEEVLLLDEPVAGLDPKVTKEMYDIIERLNREGVTIIMVSHDIAAAVHYATHILHLSRTPLFFGKKEDYVKTDIGKMFTSFLDEGGDRA